MKKLISYFIKYPIAGNILMLLLIWMGAIGMESLRKTFFPERESNQVRIQAVYPGASPAEIEEGIVLKIEDNLEGLNGIERITSSSKENLGIVTVEINSDYKTDVLIQDIKNTVDGINSFPSGMEPASVFKFERPKNAMSFALSGDLTIKELKEIARKVESDLRNDPLISQVSLSGFPDEEIEIEIDKSLIKKYGLSIEQVALAVKRDNIEVTGGTIKTAAENILIRAKNKKYSGEEFEKIVVKALPNGNVIRLKDIAVITDGWVDQPAEEFFNEVPSVIVNVEYTIHEDLKNIVDAVKIYLDKFNADNDVVQVDIVKDSSTILVERIQLLVSNGVVGFILVFFFLSLFLHPRLAFWVAMAIPVAFGGMFIVSGAAGISINVISLFGMIIVIGILVDDGIVIAENIYQHWEMGKTPVKAALDGTMEVLPAVFSAILTTVIAFSVFFVIDGIMGDFFVEMGFVVIATLVFSLIEGAFILPAHVAHSKALTKEGQKGFMVKIIAWFTRILNYMKDNWYRPVFDFAIKYPAVIIVSTAGFLVVSMGLMIFGHQKMSFFPPIYADNFVIKLEMNPGTNEDVTKSWIDHVTEKSWEVNDSLKLNEGGVITGVRKTLGPDVHKANLTVLLTRSEERSLTSAQISSIILKKVGRIPNAEKLTAKDGGPFGRPISIALYSKNNEVLEEAKQELLTGMQEMGSLKNIEASDQKGMLELEIKMKENAYGLGLTYGEVVQEIRKGFYGYEVQRLQRGLDEVKVWVRYKEEDRSSIGDLENSKVLIKGKEYLVKDLVDITQSRGVTEYKHIDGKKMVMVEADIFDVENSSSTELSSFVNDTLVAGLLERYPDVKQSVEGQPREMMKVQKSIKSRGWMILLFMFITVVLTFRSFSQAAAVFITSVFGFSGVIWGHYIHGFQMSIFSIFGMIALIGIMVNDALVLISALNINLKRGMEFIPALKKAGLSRFRPILLTSVTTVAGLAPLIFEKSMQAQFLIPMAIAIAYGLLLATFLTLVFLPSILILFNKMNKVYFWLKTGVVAENDAESEPAVRELAHEKNVDDSK